MAISASDVAKLRKMTGAGMMDCKAALEQSNGDYDEAINVLREKGKKVAAKRADREASEGCVLAKTTADKKKAVIVSLNCETDFVAKNQNFIALTDSIVNLALANFPSNIEELKQLSLGQRTVDEEISFQTGVIGEKLELACFEKLEAVQVVAYIHPGNKLATIVGFNKQVEEQATKDVAMQIAAMDPVSIDADDVPESVRENELRIAKELARNEGKPEDMLDKIAIGRLSKFYKESTLLQQDFIRDQKITVKQYLQNKDKALTVTAFKRYNLNV